MAALATEQNSPGRRDVVTGNHCVAMVFLLSGNLEQLSSLQIFLLYPQSYQLVHQVLPGLA